MSNGPRAADRGKVRYLLLTEEIAIVSCRRADDMVADMERAEYRIIDNAPETVL